MNRKKTPSFDLEVFLSSVDGGRTISRYGEGEIVFTQGDPANAVFMFGRESARSPLFPSRARKP